MSIAVRSLEFDPSSQIFHPIRPERLSREFFPDPQNYIDDFSIQFKR